jgi:hypothetical protein
MLLVVGAALWLVRRVAMPWAWLRRRWPLGVALLLMAGLAFSNRWALGPFTLFEIPLPAALEGAFAMLRSSGRFIWPLTYVVMLAAIVVVATALDRRRAVLLLAAAALLQVVDTSAGWTRTNARFERSGPDWETPLQSPFWAEAARHYRKLRRIPAVNQPAQWEALAYHAARHGMATDAVYLARVSAAALAELRARGERLLAEGGWEADTLYILNDAAAARAAGVVDPSADLLARIDGLHVLAPGWLHHAAGAPDGGAGGAQGEGAEGAPVQPNG